MDKCHYCVIMNWKKCRDLFRIHYSEILIFEDEK